MKKIYSLLLLGSLAAAGLTSCSDDDGPVKKSANAVLGIPLDSEATEAPEITQPTVVLPNPQLALQEYEGYEYLQIEMTGIWDEISSSYLTLTGTRDDEQNVWVTVDDTPKGIAINNLKDDTSARLLVDVVFLVDNSGSMGDEANTVANSIIKWSKMLAESGLDINVGCVGYGASTHAIDGAINLTSPELLTAYLQKETVCTAVRAERPWYHSIL